MTDNKLFMIAIVVGALYVLSKKTTAGGGFVWQGPVQPEVGQHMVNAFGQDMIWTGVAWVPYP